jgi:hypothetical protein
MDWATDDYTRTYADTIYVTRPDADEGVYLLDEAGRGTDAAGDPYVRVPIRSYDKRAGRCGGAPQGYTRGRAAGAPRTREGFYGNIISDRRNNPAVFNAAWDERPLHYNPGAGEDWAHLVPPPSARPPGGGPAPSLAFPFITQSEAMIRPKDLFSPNAGAGAGTSGGGGCGMSAEFVLQLIKIVLLVVIVILLAMTLSAAGRLARSLEKTVKKATLALSLQRSVGA